MQLARSLKNSAIELMNAPPADPVARMRAAFDGTARPQHLMGEKMTTSRRSVLLGTLATVPTLAVASVFGAAKARAAPIWQLPAKRPVRVVENEWIPMPDGARLAARLWLPEGAEKTPVPVVLEYIPYRKRDAYRPRDNRWGPQLAQYGIAYARG